MYEIKQVRQYIHIYTYIQYLFYNYNLLAELKSSPYTYSMIQASSRQQTPQQQIKLAIENIINSRTQNQIKEAEKCIIKLGLVQKNFNLMVNMIFDKNIDLTVKRIIVASFNLIVEEVIRHEKELQVKNRKYWRFIPEQNQNASNELKKYVMMVVNKLDRLIESKEVSNEFKQNLVKIQVKLISKKKEQWENSRISNKMEFYFRKQNTSIALTYYESSIKACYSLHSQMEYMRIAAIHLPNLVANNFIKLLKQVIPDSTLIKDQDKYIEGKQKNKRLYRDFYLSLNSIIEFITKISSQHFSNLIVDWCKNELFLNFFKSLHEQIEIAEHKGKYTGKNVQNINGVIFEMKEILEWKQILYKIISKIAENIGSKKLKNKCPLFIQFLLEFIKDTIQNSYFQVSLLFYNKFHEFAFYLPIYTVALKYELISKELIFPAQILLQQSQSINLSHKLAFLQHYIYRVYLITLDKIRSNDKQCHSIEIIQFFEEICSTKPADLEAQDFQYAYIIYFLTILEKQSELTTFTKNLIIQMFKLGNTFLYDGKEKEIINNWLQLANTSNEIKIQGRNNIEIGMVLCIVLSRQISKDLYFLKDVVEIFIKRVAVEAKDETISIFSQGKRIQRVFALLFINYLQDIELTQRNEQGQIIFIYNDFVEQIASRLISKQESEEFLNHASINLIIKYISMYNVITQHCSNSLSKAQPSFYIILQNYMANIPYGLYPEFSQHLIAYSTFHLPNETLQSTVNRVREIIIGLISMAPSQNVRLFRHEMFKLFNKIMECQEYTPIYAIIFKTITNLYENSKKQFEEYEEEIMDMCIGLLKRGQIMASVDSQTQDVLWTIVYLITQRYSTQATQVNHEGENGLQQQYRQFQIKSHDENDYEVGDNLMQNHQFKYLRLMNLAITYPVPQKLIELFFQKSKQSLELITIAAARIKYLSSRLQIQPYQVQHIPLLILLHRTIIHHHSCFTQATIEQFLNIFWINYTERLNNKAYADEINHVDGKYNLIVLLLFRYKYREVLNILRKKETNLVETILQTLFAKEDIYKTHYDLTLFVPNTLEILAFIWSPLYQPEEIHCLVKNAHFALGACFLCLDRFLELQWYEKNQRIHISQLRITQRNQHIATYNQAKQITRILKQDHPGPDVDQFRLLRKFYDRMQGRKETSKWFSNAMELYLSRRLHLGIFQSILDICKIKKKDGKIIYREFRPIGRLI